MQLYKTVGQTKTAVGDPVTVGAADDWSKTWTDLPVYEGGVAISYSVTETLKTPNGYAISGNATVTIPNGGEGSITNAYTPEETKATVKKVWNDKDNQDGKRPASLTVNLMNGKTLVQSVTLNEANGWTATVDKLPAYANGVKITYTWVEDETGLPEGYTLTDTTVNGIITTFTNSYDTEETKATVRKVWDDDNDRDGIRPKKLIVTLMARLKNEATGEITEPEKIKDVELNAGNNWTATVEDLPAKKEGAEIGYYWVENDVPKGYEVTGNSANGTVTTITNTHRITEIGVSVIKVWDDKDNQDRKRPDKLIVTLNADKVSTGKTVELNEANKWTGSIDGLPKYDLNHNEIKYTWSEDTLPEGYTLTKTETDETGYITTLTNSYTPDKISINVEKQWRDDDNRDGLRPQSIHVQLKADGMAVGESVELSEANNWKHSWTELDKNAEGKEIEYTVEETDLPAGYGITVNGTPKEGFLIINPHDPEKIEVEGVKIWQGETDKDHQRPGSVIIRLYADGAEIDYAVVSEATNWTFKFTDLYKYKAGKEIRYTITEDPVVGYSTRINGTTVTNTWTPPETPPTGDNEIIATVAMLFTSALGIAFALERKRRRNIEAE